MVFVGCSSSRPTNRSPQRWTSLRLRNGNIVLYKRLRNWTLLSVHVTLGCRPSSLLLLRWGDIRDLSDGSMIITITLPKNRRVASVATSRVPQGWPR